MGDWQELPRTQVLQRDRYTCQSCRKKFKANQLSIHHIIPRREGGTNQMENLITLCWKCHDMIELAEPPIRTKQQILYHAKALEELERQKLEIRDANEPPPKDWHAWVYGSADNPMKYQGRS